MEKSEHAVTAEELKMAWFFADLPKMPVVIINWLRIGYWCKACKNNGVCCYTLAASQLLNVAKKTERAVTPRVRRHYRNNGLCSHSFHNLI